MKLPCEFVARVALPAPASAVFAWHAEDGAFERLTPPWERVEVESRVGGGIEDVGSQVHVRVKMGPFWTRWVAEHIVGQLATDRGVATIDVGRHVSLSR